LTKRLFGLIGYPLGHSFSKQFFLQKFLKEGISDAEYELFSLPDIKHLPAMLDSNPEMKGFNVTIPYKEKVMAYLTSIDENARRIGAVNVVKVLEDGSLKGYNSDYSGFLESLLTSKEKEVWKNNKALVFGNGGSSKAVQAVLQDLSIGFTLVSRHPTPLELSYQEINPGLLGTVDLLVNCTPLGMFPNINDCLPIAYEGISSRHWVMDLVYNPEETLFLAKAKSMGAKTMNGLPMLVRQAEKAWEIWNSQDSGTQDSSKS